MLKKESGSDLWKFLGVMTGIVIAFFVTRLINLTIIPIFTDEAIYLRWAQIAASDPRWRFISLIDGKQPLLIWLFLVALKLTSFDPLVVGRLISVALGFLAMAGFSLFSWYKTRSLTGLLIGGLMYLLIPFFLLYDRMAIYESLFVALTIWTLFALYIFGTKLRLDAALISGTLIGFGLLTKSYANFFLMLLPATLLLVPWKKKVYTTQLAQWIGLVLVILVQSQLYQSILRLSEFRHLVGEKNLQFIYSFGEFAIDPFRSVYGNSIGLTTWLITYLTVPLIIFCVIAMVWYARRNWREGLFFLSWFVVPLAALAFFGKVIYPRFLLFMLPGFLIPAVLFAVDLTTRKQSRLYFLIFLLLVLLPIRFDYLLLTNPIQAPLPVADRHQFIDDWPAGYGIKEVVEYIEEESKNGPLVIGTEGTFGLFPHAIELYVGQNSNITTKAYWPLNEFPEELLAYAKEMPTFVVFKERQIIPNEWPLEMINQYQRGDGPTYLKFYRVVNKK